jgi:hypothetical protein
MVEDMPELGEVARTPTFVNGADRERRLLSKRAVIDTALAGSGLQSGPGPHVPAKAEVALQAEPRLFCLRASRVGIGCDQGRRQGAEAVLQVGVERGSLHAGGVHQRTRFVGV